MSEKLDQHRYKALEAAEGAAFFVAANYPGPDWEQMIGFTPDEKMFHQVTVGTAVDPGQDTNDFAKALMGRDASSAFATSLGMRHIDASAHIAAGYQDHYTEASRRTSHANRHVPVYANLLFAL